ncbi:HEPN domain-containing protein [Granulicella mallensis]|uniref:RiboL-PSP-HEPN domain-containing protein n=1 Tax=Granulicella mallensis (strain ATCC BAA-1857 / DSM 23137 / MP5ACTX8) TaxID=682795 RepID=G8NQX1_GRAMM|nr:HEPN domain-containing protein [Granulicella mallensis]AEU38434.1 hypothetical protein AciX8_4153 [Granulicella mallensis MP5ACTX8]
MPIIIRFDHADEIIAHFAALVTPTLDPLLSIKYAGFVAVAAVTVYEMAIKDIFMDFATKKHPVLGSITRETFDRINGRVKYKVIKEEYVPLFGNKYSTKFAKKIQQRSSEFLRLNRRDIISSYNNIVVWRNEFAHAGRVPVTATFQEVVRSYEDGKEVIKCLNSTMVR